MPSTYTLNNGIELIGTGEQSGTWGDTTNTNLELLDTALDGQVTITAASAGSSGSPNSLPISDGSASNGRNRLVNITSATDLGSTVFYQLTPNDAEKIIYIRNSLNTQDLIVFQGTYNSSNDYVVPNGTTAVIFFNGAGSGAVAANVFNNAHFDNLNIAGDVTIGDDLSLNSDGAIINIGADNDLQITHSGSAGTITNATGDLTLDVAGDIILDADGGDFKFRDGGAGFFTISNSSLDAVLKVEQSNEDFIIRGNDGGVSIDALTLDMSQAGRATFNEGIVLKSSTGGDFGVNINTASGDSMKLQVVDTGTAGAADGVITVSDGDLQLNASGGVVVNESGADADFRVESDNNANMLFVDAGADHVSIGTGEDRGGVLNVESSDNNYTVMLSCTDDDNNAGPWLGFDRRTGSAANNDNIGSIAFLGRNSAAEQVTYSEIRNYIDDVTDGTEDGIMQINVITGGSTVEYLRMAGGFGSIFNEGGADVDFRVESNNTTHMFYVDAGNDVIGIATGNVTNAASMFVNGKGIAIRNSINGSNNNWTKLSNTAAGSSSNLLINTASGSIEFTHGAGMVMTQGADGYPAVFNEGSSDSDFRVESNNNSHMIFVDAGSDKVGIGQSSPAAILHVKGSNDGTFDGVTTLILEGTEDYNSGDAGAGINFNGRYDSSNNVTTLAQISGQKATTASGEYDGFIRFGVRNDSEGLNLERMRLTHEGYLNIGRTDEMNMGANNVTGINLLGVNGIKVSNSGGPAAHLGRQGSDGEVVKFASQGTADVGSIDCTTSGTTYTTTSDLRLKTDIQPIADGTEKLMAMNPVSHKWIADPEADAVHGFIAQEMQDIVPEAVSGKPDDEDMMSMDYGRITPVLVAALQDAHKKIEALEERLAELEVK
jgi:hypothetical protein